MGEPKINVQKVAHQGMVMVTLYHAILKSRSSDRFEG
jgi:hypothetical protein